MSIQSIRLTNDIRTKMMEKITDEITIKLENSPLGKEKEQVSNDVYFLICQIMEKEYPYKEMLILSKYGVCSYLRQFCIICRLNNEIPIYEFKDYHSGYNLIPKTKDILYPKYSDSSVIKYLNANIPLNNRKYWFEVFDRWTCELNEVISSYQHILNGLRTVKQLNEAHPGLIKYLPQNIFKNTSVKVDISKSLKIVKLFEAEK